VGRGRPGVPPLMPPSRPPATVYRVYSDGAQPGAAAKGDRRVGPGGWGVLVVGPGGVTAEACGYAPATTVPRMEMYAALKGLELTPPGATAVVTSDSQLLVRGATDWIEGWIRKGWRTSTGRPVENRDLWERLLLAMRNRTVTWEWVRGHAGHPQNERADRLAANGAAGLTPDGHPGWPLPGPANRAAPRGTGGAPLSPSEEQPQT
jgi:ribonuclease HI